jgi:hypothetical protein
MIDACNIKRARMHARSNHHGLERLLSEIVGARRCIEAQLDAAVRNPAAVD